MATETLNETTETTDNNNGLLIGISMIGGAGITVMMVAAGVGVIDPNIDDQMIGLLLLTGLVAVIGACVAWFAVVQPHKNFDDINQPLYHGHHHEDDHSDEDSEEEQH